MLSIKSIYVAKLQHPILPQNAAKHFLFILFFSCLFGACGEALPEEKTLYLFPFGTHVDAAWLDCGYKSQEKCGDATKRQLREEVGDVSLEEQIAIGKDFHEHLPYPIAEDAARQEKIADIIDRMRPFLKNQDFKHDAYVLNTSEVNAFTIPGGNVYVTVGLINSMPSEDALAYVIGHELGHNENNHTKESAILCKYMEKQEANGGFFASLQAMYIGLKSNYCGQADELESDITGIYLAEKVGYNPVLALKAVEVLKKMDVKKPESSWKKMLIDVLRSHPWSEDREKCLKDYVTNAYTVAKCAKVYDGEKAIVNTKSDPLILREYPNVNAEKVAALPKGSTVKLICDCVQQANGRNFTYVKNDENAKGWVDSKYLMKNSKAALNIGNVEDDAEIPVKNDGDCKLEIINLHCETTTMRGFDDEIRIWVNDKRIGKSYYKISKGNSKGINVTIPFEDEAQIKVKEVDTFNDDELGEESINCDDSGVRKLTFTGKGAKYILSYQIVR
jgi:hypothetical protein